MARRSSATAASVAHKTPAPGHDAPPAQNEPQSSDTGTYFYLNYKGLLEKFRELKQDSQGQFQLSFIRGVTEDVRQQLSLLEQGYTVIQSEDQQYITIELRLGSGKRFYYALEPDDKAGVATYYKALLNFTKRHGDASLLENFNIHFPNFVRTREDFITEYDGKKSVVNPNDPIPADAEKEFEPMPRHTFGQTQEQTTARRSTDPKSDDERIVTGERPASLRPQIYKKRDVPPSAEAVKEANQVLNQTRTRKKEGYQFSEAELEIVRAAGRIKSAYDKHSKLAKQRQKRPAQSRRLAI